MSGRESAAHHEAAHAVVACRLGRHWGPATITPDAGASASAPEWATGSPEALWESYRRDIVVLFAGHCAALRFGPGETGSAGDDEDKAAMLLSMIPPASECRPFNEPALRAEAARLVETNWPAIEAVAQALLSEETLEGELARHIVDGVDQGHDWRTYLEVLRRRGYPIQAPRTGSWDADAQKLRAVARALGWAHDR